MGGKTKTVILQVLRWCALAILLSLAWQTVVVAESADEAPPLKEAVKEPPKAPPGPADEFDRGTPRTAVAGYIAAVREGDFERAAEYLDLRNLQHGLSAEDGPLLARQLAAVINRVLWIEADLLSEDPEGHSDDGQPSYRDYVDSIEVDDGRIDILLQPLSNAAKAVIVTGSFVLWLDNIGFEVTTLLTGLGLGGVALALAAQKSVEDIFGAVTLFSAAPVRVGDFCRFGDRIGTVEEIGLRITRIRTLDRTVVSVPNGRFAAMEIENFATREKFRYAPRLRLRYGTSPDQLRYVIGEMQRLFHAHPKVIPPPAKARFTNFGEYSLEFDVFTYVDASSFDEFQEVAEDLNLRVMEIVKAAGTDFAVPEKVVSVSKARQPDEEAARAAEAQVARWREKGELPLPALPQEEIEKISNTLEYPPEGSKG